MSQVLSNQRPIIVKKSIVQAAHAHHGGAWKVAYADFVTAMMAFFLLMWLLGATTEKQRKALADYFAPTVVEQKHESAGANGLLEGGSVLGNDVHASRTAQPGTRTLTVTRDSMGDVRGGKNSADAVNFASFRQNLRARLARDKALSRFAKSVRFTETKEGLRLDLVDDANYSMFLVGTDVLTPEAQRLLPVVAQALADIPNEIRIRGHTDASVFSKGIRSNWTLSTARADATRRQLMMDGIPSNRFGRIEGVADREPYNPGDPFDQVNRRISVTLAATGSDKEGGPDL